MKKLMEIPLLSTPRVATMEATVPDIDRAQSAALFKQSGHLLETIATIRGQVGEGLNDHELTALLERMGLPSEFGFSFLMFFNGFVTLTVPPQNLENWYRETGWIAEKKRRIATTISGKLSLSLSEPPDEIPHRWACPSELTNLRHHLELGNHSETVVIAHPLYLKVRIGGPTSSSGYLPNVIQPLTFGHVLLRELSMLY